MERERGGSDAHCGTDPGSYLPRVGSRPYQQSTVLVVYIGQASLQNFHYGREWGIWGFKESLPDYEQINVGDFIIFGRGVSGGGPRTPLVEWVRHSVQEVVVGRITEALYYDTEPFWPDEHTPGTSYPYRVRFEEVIHFQDVSLQPSGPLGEASDALRRAGSGGRAQVLQATQVPLLQNFVPQKSDQGTTRPSRGSCEFEVAPLPSDWDWPSAMDELIRYINATGFYFEPWQIATFVTALRTKPFVILAGISGTGKSKLPRLVAEACGLRHETIPVRPDWTDSSDLLGYFDLQGRFRPGVLLRMAQYASADIETSHIAVLDEMNLARVEHYFAEVLSRIEERRIVDGKWLCDPLLSSSEGETSKDPWQWSRVALAPNLAIVGTVNMDESTHGFSRKVLDRAFTLELSDVQLDVWESQGAVNGSPDLMPWPAAALVPKATNLASLGDVTAQDRALIQRVIEALQLLNRHLQIAQLQVGYRVRDELALFVLNAQDVRESFTTNDGETVDPLDLGITMKVLPRIMGGSGAIRSVLCGVMAWAIGRTQISEEEADELTDEWRRDRRTALTQYPYPRCAARACLMWDRLREDGFTSYWL